MRLEERQELRRVEGLAGDVREDLNAAGAEIVDRPLDLRSVASGSLSGSDAMKPGKRSG